LYRKLLKLLENQPMDRPVALVVDFKNTEKSPKDHKLQYAFAVKDDLDGIPNTTKRTYHLPTEMPEESSLERSNNFVKDVADLADQKENNLAKLFLVIKRKTRSYEDKTIIIDTSVVTDHYSLSLQCFGQKNLQLAPNARFYLPQLKTISVGKLIAEVNKLAKKTT